MTRRGGRRGSPDGVTIISWRDIPTQVTVTFDGETGKWLLPDRFQHAVDRAAAVAGLTDATDYVAQFRRDTHPAPAVDERPGNAAETAEAIAALIEADYPTARMHPIVANGGVDDG